MKTLSKYKKAQKTLGRLFFISISVLFISLILIMFGSFFVLQSSKSEMPRLSNSSAPPAPVPTSSGATANSSNRRISPTPAPEITYEPGTPVLIIAILVVGGFSLFTTIFSFLGFLGLTIFVWRKEKREKETFRLESAKKEIEIEKLRFELEKSKNTSGTKIKKCTICNRSYFDISQNFCLDDGTVLSEAYSSEEFKRHSPEKTLNMENFQTDQAEAKTVEIESRPTAK